MEASGYHTQAQFANQHIASTSHHEHFLPRPVPSPRIMHPLPSRFQHLQHQAFSHSMPSLFTDPSHPEAVRRAKSFTLGSSESLSGLSGGKRKGAPSQDDDLDEHSISPMQTNLSPTTNPPTETTTTLTSATSQTHIPKRIVPYKSSSQQYLTGSLPPDTIVSRPQTLAETFPSTRASPWCIPQYKIPGVTAEIAPAVAQYNVPPPSPDVRLDRRSDDGDVMMD
ncbi:hypothetical protein HDU97_008954 [Phlyctochytrium planicorne]|nr:hypothetical protein HDU97_008954 [Phlyctochytrium planicorne]